MAEPQLLVESPPRSPAPASGETAPSLPTTAPTAPPRRRQWLRLAILVVGLLVGSALARRTIWAPHPVAVAVSRVERGRVEETVTNSRAGTVKARRRAQLSPDVGGRVLELPFRAGDRVPAGAVVLRLDDSIVRAQLAVAERDLAAAQAQSRQACLAAEQARRELERNRALAAQGIVSADVLDRLSTAASTQAAGCEAAGRGAERARAAVGLAQAELGRTVLRAPFAAVVAEASTHVGEFVTPAPPGVPMPPVMDLLDPTTVYVSAPMDEVDAARLRAGLQVRVTLDPLPGRELAGTVARVAPYVLDVEQQNRTVEIEVELADRALAATLLPGTSADVEVILGVRDGVLRIPTPALQEERKVLVLDGDRLAEREVRIGLRNWDFSEVTGGLAAGEAVVLSLDRDGVEAGAQAVAESGPAKR
jgi:HlyD family secretion protein